MPRGTDMPRDNIAQVLDAIAAEALESGDQAILDIVEEAAELLTRDTPSIAQMERAGELMRNFNARGATITIETFDLPSGYIALTIRGRQTDIVFGIDREGKASS